MPAHAVQLPPPKKGEPKEPPPQPSSVYQLLAGGVCSGLGFPISPNSPALESAQLWRFLMLVYVHPLEQLIEFLNRLEQIGAFVEHHAFGLRSHCRIGHPVEAAGRNYC